MSSFRQTANNWRIRIADLILKLWQLKAARTTTYIDTQADISLSHFYTNSEHVFATYFWSSGEALVSHASKDFTHQALPGVVCCAAKTLFNRKKYEKGLEWCLFWFIRNEIGHDRDYHGTWEISYTECILDLKTPLFFFLSFHFLIFLFFVEKFSFSTSAEVGLFKLFSINRHAHRVSPYWCPNPNWLV